MSDALFPASFLWGAATSAYQIEGAPLADGAGPSIWHRYAHTPGHTHQGQTGDVACGHYHRWREDVALMQGLGLRAYRFSIAWGRVLPEGTGRINNAGLAFYDRLVDALLGAGIEPCVTLYHWDLPAALHERGGWLNPDVAGWFAEYACVVFDALGDRVRRWATINEPWVVMDGGYVRGGLAPGLRDRYAGPRVAHHLLLAHAEAVRAYRATGRGGAIGIVVNLEPKVAATDGEDDRMAADHADAYMNRLFLDPLLLGRYPDDLAAVFGDAWTDFPADDLALIQAPIDYLGINYYTRAVVAHDPEEYPDGARRVRQDGRPHTEMGWEVCAPALRDLLVRVADDYPAVPLYVTENGAAFYDPPRPIDGRVDDPLRTAFLRDHLLAVREAMDAGADVRGYFAWSLLDNFEWSQGYAKRFGLVHVDVETLARTPKASAHFYRAVIESGGDRLNEPLP